MAIAGHVSRRMLEHYSDIDLPNPFLGNEANCVLAMTGIFDRWNCKRASVLSRYLMQSKPVDTIARM